MVEFKNKFRLKNTLYATLFFVLRPCFQRLDRSPVNYTSMYYNALVKWLADTESDLTTERDNFAVSNTCQCHYDITDTCQHHRADTCQRHLISLTTVTSKNGIFRVNRFCNLSMSDMTAVNMQAQKVVKTVIQRKIIDNNK